MNGTMLVSRPWQDIERRAEGARRLVGTLTAVGSGLAVAAAVLAAQGFSLSDVKEALKIAIV